MNNLREEFKKLHSQGIRPKDIASQLGIDYPIAKKWAKSIKDTKYRKNHREELLRKKKIFRDSHKEEISTYKKEHYDAKKDHERYLKRYEEHKETIKLKSKEYNRLNKAKCNERVRKYSREHLKEGRIRATKWRNENRDKLKIYSKRFRITHKEKEKLRHRQYKQTPEGKATSARITHRYKTHVKNTECTLTAEQWESILNSQNYKCNGYPHGACDVKFDDDNFPCRDHIIPVSKGGGLTLENVQALCNSCNAKKGNRLDKSKINTWLINVNPSHETGLH
jgi:5-methylcytosine-specific restriction endonuclease McrA